MISVPLNDTAALNEDIFKQWMPGPRTRGTIDILWTCLVTIILCVWSAIHMNVPPPREKRFRPILRRAMWVICGLLLPEYVLWTAWRQFSSAWGLVKALNKERERGLRKGDPQTSRLESFDLRYGFFVVMGGIRVNLLVELGYDHPSNRNPLTLTPDGMEFLAELGIFVPLDDAQIKDRSKANAFAKILVCAQISWLLVDCIGRLSSGLPLTLLEVHTFIHVICSLCIYGLWFKKPFDVIGAIYLLSAEAIELLTLTHVLNELRRSGEFYSSCYQPLNEFLEFVGTDMTKTIDSEQCAKIDFMKKVNWTIRTITENEATVLFSLKEPLEAHGPYHFEVPLFELVPLDTSTRQMTARAWETIQKTNTERKSLRKSLGALTDRAPDFVGGSNTVIDLFEDHKLAMVGILIEFVYGGVHVAAWKSHFPSIVEMWMWRSSSLLIGGAILLWYPLYHLLKFLGIWTSGAFGEFGEFWDHKTHWKGRLWISLKISEEVFINGISTLCFFARLFLIVESFISLRSVPIGVYATVPWANYIAHI